MSSGSKVTNEREEVDQAAPEAAPEKGAGGVEIPAGSGPFLEALVEAFLVRTSTEEIWRCSDELAERRKLRAAEIRGEARRFQEQAVQQRGEAVARASGRLEEGLSEVLEGSLARAEQALRGLDGLAGPAEQFEALRQGVEEVLEALQAKLAEAGLEEIDAAGGPFDPNFHEAVGAEESREAGEGEILRQFLRGYALNGRLIRPAKVVVAKAPEDEGQAHG